MKFLFSILILSTSLSAFALDCKNAVTDYDMRECEGIRLKAADDSLNKNYAELRTILDAGSKNEIKQAQLAWIAFRDAECVFSSDVNKGGTLGRLSEMSCLTRLTKKRASELKNEYQLRNSL